MLEISLLQVGINSLAGAFNGAQRHISHVALGDEGYSVDREQSALVNERLRVPVTDGRDLGDGLIEVSALITSEMEFAVREVGFVLDNGVMLGIWSHPQNILLHMTPKTRHIEHFTLQLSGVPTGSVTVDQTGLLNLSIGPELVQMTIAQTMMATTMVKQSDALMQVNQQIKELK